MISMLMHRARGLAWLWRLTDNQKVLSSNLSEPTNAFLNNKLVG